MTASSPPECKQRFLPLSPLPDWVCLKQSAKTGPVFSRADCSLYRFSPVLNDGLWITHKSGMFWRVLQQQKGSQYRRNSLPEGQGSWRQLLDIKSHSDINHPLTAEILHTCQRCSWSPCSSGLGWMSALLLPAKQLRLWFSETCLGSSKHAQALNRSLKQQTPEKLHFLGRSKVKLNVFASFSQFAADFTDLRKFHLFLIK